MAEAIAPQSSLKALIAKGKEQSYLTYAEVNDHLPESISDPDQVEDIIQMINDMGIKVFETAPDADALLLNEDEGDSGAGDGEEVRGAESSSSLSVEPLVEESERALQVVANAPEDERSSVALLGRG